MLHELLLALSGHHGQIFTLQKDPKRFKVTSSLNLFHPAESHILSELLSLGCHYHTLQQFILKHRDAANIRRGSCYDRTEESNEEETDDFQLGGLYVESLCEGIEEVLLPYTNALMELERSILHCGNIQMTHIQHKMAPFQPILTALNGLINQLYLRKCHGCYILDVIYKASCSGVASVKDAMNRLLFEGHKVLYKQLLSWVLQGSLYDPYQEFFIAEQGLVPSALSTSQGNFHGSQMLLTEDSSSQFQTKAKKYKLKADMVPGHISLKLAEKIFFIGESIQLFESDRKLEVQGAVLRERETEFYQQLSLLRDQPEFRVSDFERFVDTIREAASRHLHTLVLERADLKGELNMARDFFLLGRGELFHTFIEQADVYLQKPVSATTQHDVNQAFLSACRAILLNNDDDLITKKIKLLLNNSVGTEKSQTAIQGWKCLSIRYSVPWPLHLVLSDRNLDDYNRIFGFLITVKRTQLGLHKVWAAHMREKVECHTYLFQLRTHMTFVVDNLQQYFMADVLESQYAIMIKKLDASVNFEELRHSHEVFLNSVISQTFLDHKPIHQCLTELLGCCLHFIRQLDSNPNPSTLGSLGLTFSRQSGLLFQLLSSLRNHQAGSHLSQLLLRIDFNRYYSKHGHDVGNIVA